MGKENREGRKNLKGQASIEALMILAVVLAVVATLQFTGENTNETNSAISAARTGAEKAINSLAIKYDEDIDVSSWEMDGDNIIFTLSVQGSPPPENETIRRSVRENALDQVESAVGGGYGVAVEIERVKK